MEAGYRLVVEVTALAKAEEDNGWAVLIHAAANFASFFAFRGRAINESTFCFMV